MFTDLRATAISCLTGTVMLALAGTAAMLTTNTPAQASAMQLCVVHVASNDMLNVRSGPGVQHPVVHTLAPGACDVRATGECSGNWCRIAYVGGQGWAHMRYLSADAGGENGLGATYTDNLLGDGFYCPEIAHDDILNVREGPGTAFSIIGGFRIDDCDIEGTGLCVGAWCEVAAPKAKGWVNTRFLRGAKGS